ATLSGFNNGETLATSDVTGSASCTTTATSSSAVGSYTITCAQGTLAAGNYSFGPFVTGTLTITKAPLTVKVSASGPYGSSPSMSGLPATNTALTSSGVVGSDSASNAVGGTLTCSTPATNTSAVGSYPVTGCAGLTASNYTISYDSSSSYQVTAKTLTVK